MENALGEGAPPGESARGGEGAWRKEAVRGSSLGAGGPTGERLRGGSPSWREPPRKGGRLEERSCERKQFGSRGALKENAFEEGVPPGESPRGREGPRRKDTVRGRRCGTGGPTGERLRGGSPSWRERPRRGGRLEERNCERKQFGSKGLYRRTPSRREPLLERAPEEGRALGGKKL